MNQISISDQGAEIQEAFIKKFTMTWDEFQVRHKEWIERMQEKGYPVFYDDLYLWEKMPDYQEISFASALEFLKSLDGDVFFMSENEIKRDCQGITVNGMEQRGIVAEMNATALANLIEYEWYESWRLGAEGMYLENPVLPEDLYVFDPPMEHMIVFTHENEFWELELEQPMKAAASRFCMTHGFSLSKSMTYDKI